MRHVQPHQARGRPSRLTLTLTAEERQHLRQLAFSPRTPAHLVPRARLLLLVAGRCRVQDIAQVVGLSRGRVYKWVARWEQAGLAGLENRHRRAV